MCDKLKDVRTPFIKSFSPLDEFCYFANLSYSLVSIFAHLNDGNFV